MSELKMRDALITAREFLVLEGNAEDNLAIVKIDEALAQHHSAVVELTDEEVEDAYLRATGSNLLNMHGLRAVIAAHIAKQGGVA